MESLPLTPGLLATFGPAKPGYPSGVLLATLHAVDENGERQALGEQHLSAEFLEVAPDMAKRCLADSARGLLKQISLHVVPNA